MTPRGKTPPPPPPSKSLLKEQHDQDPDAFKKKYGVDKGKEPPPSKDPHKPGRAH